MEKPEIKYRAGAISASVWNNQGKSKDGTAANFKTISLQRTYKDKDGTWKHTNSMRISDLPKAIVVLNKTFERLVLSNNLESGDTQ